MQALIGDSTDNVPGVPGIGPKTAAELIKQYDDLETVLLRASEIKQEKRRQALIDNAEKARLSKRLVTLDDTVKLEVPLADLAVHQPDYKRLVAFLKAMEFTTLVRRIAEACGIDASEIEPDSAGENRGNPAAPRRRHGGSGPGRNRAGTRCGECSRTRIAAAHRRAHEPQAGGKDRRFRREAGRLFRGAAGRGRGSRAGGA